MLSSSTPVSYSIVVKIKARNWDKMSTSGGVDLDFVSVSCNALSDCAHWSFGNSARTKYAPHLAFDDPVDADDCTRLSNKHEEGLVAFGAGKFVGLYDVKVRQQVICTEGAGKSVHAYDYYLTLSRLDCIPLCMCCAMQNTRLCQTLRGHTDRVNCVAWVRRRGNCKLKTENSSAVPFHKDSFFTCRYRMH